MENKNQSFWKFSDQLRLQTPNNDSIWANTNFFKHSSERKNFDIRVGAELHNPPTNFNDGWNSFKSNGSNLINNNLNPLGSDNIIINNKPKGSHDFNGFNDGWKINMGSIIGNSAKENGNIGNDLSKGKLYNYKLGNSVSNHNGFNFKTYRNAGGTGGFGEVEIGGGKSGKKNGSKVKNSVVGENGNDGKSTAAVDKRFKTLPASESLPRNERIGGYIFVCNNDTMQENLRRQLFGLPPRYRDSVRAITPGLPLFLYNYSTHQLHGIFEAASFGGSNIDPTAWEDKKCPGESRFPAQVRVITRKICEALEEDSFRPILHHYDGPKFRLELSIPEVISLLDILKEQNP